MDFLRTLLLLQCRRRYYALLDPNGVCLSFKHCREAPKGQQWVEIGEPNLSWLRQPLPTRARIVYRARAITARHLLSI
ncbi:hypothetical protein [Pseudomonas sp. LP_7_YM]|uniref:hypothetical protein n=1 Tax=Pseudomonas sp. LP_7_YM TaxID=2485137 RepID=UPI00105F24E7|nr:hypothetical protein [Pseudomonas sp. LP_7_YM]TDV69775.1 hypothetical protein EC915_10233 [Pseudomonas sp. LP_7_YM]